MIENTTITASEAVAAEEERARPCFVRHPDAGGQCWEPAAVEVYGLHFCESHGQEAKLAALTEEYEDASSFFERFRAQHVPALSDLIEHELSATLTRLAHERPTDDGYQRALLRAYPSGAVPDKVRQQTLDWIADEQQDRLPVADILLNMLLTLCKSMREAHGDEQIWLVEDLEQKRESLAAQAAVAVGEWPEFRGDRAS